MRLPFLLSSYRFFQSVVVRYTLLPFVFSAHRRKKMKHPFYCTPIKNEDLKRPCLWFHAASVGEFESLWTLILGCVNLQYDLILTTFSESAEVKLLQLTQILLDQKAHLLWSGYCPWEGEWMHLLQKWHPSLFITVKYEAWPDLWVSLAECKIPLVIIGARSRRSVKFAKGLCQKILGFLPQLILLPSSESEAQGLKEVFPDAWIQVLADPRWDQVHSRLQKGNPRATELMHFYQDSPRPWGIVGNAWPEDVAFLMPWLKQYSGTIWVVPHQVNDRMIQTIQSILETHHLHPILTTSIAQKNECPVKNPSLAQPTASLQCLLVNEMGFLSELYAAADWAFVGGGFGIGVHNTIEPAIHGIPIGIGPNGSEKFSEIHELQMTQQLRILQNVNQLQVWSDEIKQSAMGQKDFWRQEAQKHLGVTASLLKLLQHMILKN